MKKSKPRKVIGTKMPLPKKVENDFYGNAIKNPEGKQLRSYLDEGDSHKTNTRTPPKKMA